MKNNGGMKVVSHYVLYDMNHAEKIAQTLNLSKQEQGLS